MEVTFKSVQSSYRDHAGIATQLLVERSLLEEGTSKAALGREAFLQRVWAWKEEKGGYITQQMRRLGASADWTRERFTLEPDMSEAVTEAFMRLHAQGLIYKGDYMVNWSPNLQTAVSDLEVDYSEELGTLYYFKYMLAPAEGIQKDGLSTEEQIALTEAAAAEATRQIAQSTQSTDTGAQPSKSKTMKYYSYIPVATTRPETILGDTAVCVHPDDERYKHLIGRMVKVPMSERLIPGMLLYADDDDDDDDGCVY